MHEDLKVSRDTEKYLKEVKQFLLKWDEINLPDWISVKVEPPDSFNVDSRNNLVDVSFYDSQRIRLKVKFNYGCEALVNLPISKSSYTAGFGCFVEDFILGQDYRNVFSGGVVGNLFFNTYNKIANNLQREKSIIVPSFERVKSYSADMKYIARNLFNFLIVIYMCVIDIRRREFIKHSVYKWIRDTYSDEAETSVVDYKYLSSDKLVLSIHNTKVKVVVIPLLLNKDKPEFRISIENVETHNTILNLDGINISAKCRYPSDAAYILEPVIKLCKKGRGLYESFSREMKNDHELLTT